MQKDHLLFQSWAISIVASFTLIDLILTANPLLAQITPDETLGGERSTVTREVIRGINGDRISGGARRGQNLFHSFQQFDVNEGLGAYFDNPADVQRIFSRVTGSDRSEILGTLGVLGNADLFFINPNGILFGPNSTLDLGGSFAATTANGIQFGDQGFFSATTPELPSPLLTVNPSAFLFNQVPIGNIANQSIAPNGTTPDGSPAFGLRVPDGESLLLLGGDIEMDGGRLNAFGGRIELGGLAGVGTVGLNQTGDILSLSFLPNSVLADVTLVNDARVAVRGSGGGDIIVNADEFTATNGGRLVAGVETAGDGGNILINADQVNLAGVGLSGIASGIYQEIFPNATGSTGNINVNTRSLQMQSGAEISTTTYGAGDAGEVSVTADTIELVGLDSNISSGTDGDSTGNGGDVTVSSQVLQLRDGAKTSARTYGSGQGGNLSVTATEQAELSGSAINAQGGVFVSGLFATTSGTGNAGSLQFEGGQLQIRDGALVSAATYGAGDAGDISVTADTIELVGMDTTRKFRSGIRGGTDTDSTGNGGDVTVSSRVLQVQDGAAISVITNNSRQGGNLHVTATKRAELFGNVIDVQGGVFVSGLFAVTFGIGNAGNLQFEGGQLQIRDGAQISATTYGAGDAGDISVTADTIELVGVDATLQVASGISSGAHGSSTGNGGDVTVLSRVLQVQDGAFISVATDSSGQGGNLHVTATERAELSDSGATAQERTTGTGLSASTLGTGNAGNLKFEGGQLQIRDGALISATTYGAGDAGDVSVTADTIELVGLDATRQFASNINSDAQIGSTGNGGSVTIFSRVLQVQDGATITADTRSSGQGGNLHVTTTERAELSGSAINAQGGVFVSGLFATTFSTGNAGNLQFEGGQLQIRDGAAISAETVSAGDAGDVSVTADTIELVGLDATLQESSTISSEVSIDSIGNGGNVTVSSRVLQVQDGATITADTRSSGQGGNLYVTATERAELSGSTTSEGEVMESGLFATTSGSGNAGTLQFEGGQLQIRDGAGISVATLSSGNGGSITLNPATVTLANGARISATTEGSGSSGSIQIQGANEVNLDNSTISTAITTGSILSNPTANQGNIDIQTQSLSLANNAEISASTSGQGNAGSITIRDADQVSLLSNSTISTAVEAGAIGRGGNISLHTGSLNLADLAQITASTSGQGDTGRIFVQAEDGISLVNNSSISSTVNPGATGNSQQITLHTPNLILRGNSQLSAATRGNGIAGDILIRGTNSRESDQISIFNSTISTEVQNSGIAANRTALMQMQSGNNSDRQGDITIETHSLVLDNNAQITASTNGRDRAGDITIRGAEEVTLSDRSHISTEVNRRGVRRGGRINIHTQTLSLDDQSRISARTRGQGRAGNIDVLATLVSLSQGSQLLTNTASSQNAGSITLTVTDRIVLDGQGSGIFASTQPGSRGRGGSITLHTTTLNLGSGAAISSASRGSDQAGNVRIQATETLEADHGNITTSATNAAGGAITITGGNIHLSDNSTIRTDVGRGTANGGNVTVTANDVRLRGNSDIQTRVAQGQGNGGDIVVQANSIIAFDDSDIISNAPNQGGDITLDTPVFFGSGYQSDASADGNPDGNDRVDLDASGAVSSGAVQTPNTDFIQNSLADLAETVVDADSLIANSCIVRTNEGGTFLITGSGGLPPNRPGVAPLPPYPAGEVRTGNNESETEQEHSSWQPGDAIVEPQGVFRLTDGRLVMSRECQ